MRGMRLAHFSRCQHPAKNTHIHTTVHRPYLPPSICRPVILFCRSQMSRSQDGLQHNVRLAPKNGFFGTFIPKILRQCSRTRSISITSSDCYISIRMLSLEHSKSHIPAPLHLKGGRRPHMAVTSEPLAGLQEQRLPS